MPDEILVASQLGDELDRRLQARLPQIRVIGVPRGAAVIPPDVPILFATVHAGTPEERERSRPAGWPFGLQWVQLISAGIDNYPRWLFEVEQVTTGRGTAAHPVSEYALAALFAAAKQIPAIWVDGPAQWKQTPLVTLHGSMLGIVGLGAIGSALAAKAMGLGMTVRALRRSEGPLPLAGVERAASVADLFATCDHVVLAAPASAATHHLVNAEVLAGAKPGLNLVNVARGSLIDQAALLDALDAGRIGSATLDVTDPEPLPAGHALYHHPRVRISAHTSAISTYTHAALLERFADNLARFLDGEPLLERVVGA